MECVPGKLASGKISPQKSAREGEKTDIEESRSCRNIFIFLRSISLACTIIALEAD